MASSPPPAAVPSAASDDTPVAAPILEADNEYSDADSSFGSEASGSSYNYGSVTSSIYNYRVENGRTYHAYADGKYLLPNDEQEQNRMDMIYHATMLLFNGKPFFAPIKNPQRIVDMGTGTGIWALDVGDAYPEAHVIGIDLSPQQPKWTAPNVEFRVDDFEQPWVFDSPLDLVHSRLCTGSAIKSWPNYLAEAYKSLRPGGWVEAQDFSCNPRTDDDSIPEGSKLKHYHELFIQGMTLVGGDLDMSPIKMRAFLEDAGFVNIGVVECKWPLAPWAKDKRLKEVGEITMLSIYEDMPGMSLGLFTRVMGWDRIEIELLIGEVRKEWVKKGIHAYYPLYSIFAQKPGAKDNEEKVEVDDGPAAPAATAA